MQHSAKHVMEHDMIKEREKAAVQRHSLRGPPRGLACMRAQGAARHPTRGEPLVGANGGGALASLPIVALLSQGPKNKWEPSLGKIGEERSGVHRHIFLA